MFCIVINFHSIWLNYMNQFPENWTGRVGKFDSGPESSSGWYRVFIWVERAVQVWYIKIYIYIHRVDTYTYIYLFQFMFVSGVLCWCVCAVAVQGEVLGKCTICSTIALNTSMFFGLWFCLCIWFFILVSVCCIFSVFVFFFYWINLQFAKRHHIYKIYSWDLNICYSFRFLLIKCLFMHSPYIVFMNFHKFKLSIESIRYI